MMMLIGAALIIGIATSTAEGRAEARKRMARWNVPLAIATAAIWAVLLAPW